MSHEQNNNQDRADTLTMVHNVLQHTYLLPIIIGLIFTVIGIIILNKVIVIFIILGLLGVVLLWCIKQIIINSNICMPPYKPKSNK